MIFANAQSEATTFYDELLPEAAPAGPMILRQSLAGMIWSKQFFHFDVARWLRRRPAAAADGRKNGRNGAGGT